MEKANNAQRAHGIIHFKIGQEAKGKIGCVRSGAFKLILCC
jgi:hypothetical protein